MSVDFLCCLYRRVELTECVVLEYQMFSFGLIALEQFTDRLVEWPQYCNHILQISHMRENHGDLVEFIERALARVTAGQTEPAGNVPSSVEQPQVTGGQVFNLGSSVTAEPPEVSGASVVSEIGDRRAPGHGASQPRFVTEVRKIFMFFLDFFDRASGGLFSCSKDCTSGGKDCTTELVSRVNIVYAEDVVSIVAGG